MPGRSAALADDRAQSAGVSAFAKSTRATDRHHSVMGDDRDGDDFHCRGFRLGNRDVDAAAPRRNVNPVAIFAKSGEAAATVRRRGAGCGHQAAADRPLHNRPGLNDRFRSLMGSAPLNARSAAVQRVSRAGAGP